MIAQATHDAHVDVWALGVLAYEFIAGHPPFEAASNVETYRRITSVDLHFPKENVEGEEVPLFSPEAQDFIRSLLQRNAKARLSLTKVRTHPWVLKIFGPPKGQKRRTRKEQGKNAAPSGGGGGEERTHIHTSPGQS